MFASFELTELTRSDWLYFPTALVLGALHGLEPGHSKTMMAAFIIAVRGTVRQAVLLGLAATLSHTVIIWVIVALTLLFKDQIQAEHFEPWMHMISGALVIFLSCWMAWRIRRESRPHAHAHHPGHEHPHAEEHAHRHDHADHRHDHEHGHPRNHGHDHHGQHHAHPHEHPHDHDLAHLEADDAHAREHAEDIRRRFAGRTVTTGQIVLFGLTGGLLPCPGAITVALLSLQANQAVLGFALVVAFSLGLALTLVGVGAAAAWGAGHASRRFGFFRRWAPRLPYLSVAVLLLIGGLLLRHGYQGLHGHTH
jgi:nickel/cobalt transporter (NicO) family protein